MPKICLICQKEKKLNEFYRNKANSDGRSSYCIQCAKAKSTKQRRVNKGIIDITDYGKDFKIIGRKK